MVQNAGSSSLTSHCTQGLESAGFTPRFHPVLQFTPQAEKELRDVLKEGAPFTHAILSSAQAVKALQNQWQHESMNLLWSQKGWFVVGKKTAKALSVLVSVDPVVEDNAELLSEQLRNNLNGQQHNVIFFAGNQALSTIPRTLEEAVIPYRRINVYQTTTKCPPWTRANNEVLCFFSPSGVRAVVESGCCNVQTDIAVAFGPSTERKLRECGFNRLVVCAAPTPEQLRVAVQKSVDMFT